MSEKLLIVKKNNFITQLQSWYACNQRSLPFRREPSVYKTIVSEFMLQQTQVSVVIPYFDRWLKKFPDLQSLAQASTEAVLKQWEGLGYYRRARNLHKLAQEIAPLSVLPKTTEAWLKFTGVGPYTAAAIVSIAFNVPEAAVDWNVVRILSRLIAEDKFFKNKSQALKSLAPLAKQLLDVGSPGDYNQAMMELGATICTPKKPQCSLCPVSAFCTARHLGYAESYPKIDLRRKSTTTVQRAWVVQENKILLRKYALNASRLAGIFELPMIVDIELGEHHPRELLAVKNRVIGNEKIQELIFAICPTRKMIVHTSRRLGLHWVDIQKIESLTLSGPHKRWISEILVRGN